MGSVIRRAEDLGEDEVVDILALLKVDIARRAASQRERERLRSRLKRRFSRRVQSRKETPSKNDGRAARPRLYLVVDDPPAKK